MACRRLLDSCVVPPLNALQATLDTDEGAARLYAAANWLLRQASCRGFNRVSPTGAGHRGANWPISLLTQQRMPCHPAVTSSTPALLQLFSVFDAGPLVAPGTRMLQEMECLQVGMPGSGDRLVWCQAGHHLRAAVLPTVI